MAAARRSIEGLQVGDLKALTPFVAALVIWMNCEYVKRVLAFEENLPGRLVLAPLNNFPSVGSGIVARIEWGLGILTLAGSWLLAIGGAFWIIWKALGARRGYMWLFLALGLLALIIPLPWSRPTGTLTLPPFQTVLEESFGLLGVIDGEKLERRASYFALSAGLMIVIASAATLLPIIRTEGVIEEVHRRIAMLRKVLYLGTGVLVAATIQNALMHRLPLLAMTGEQQGAMESVGQSITLAGGLVWTMVLAVVYFPADWILRGYGQDVASMDPGRPAEKPPEDWFSEKGSTYAGLKTFGRIIAVLAPLLTGGLPPILEALEKWLGTKG